MSLINVDDRIRINASIAKEAGYITQREFSMMTDGRVSYQDRGIARQLLDRDFGADAGVGGLLGSIVDGAGDRAAANLYRALDEKIASQGGVKTSLEFLSELWGRLTDPDTSLR